MEYSFSIEPNKIKEEERFLVRAEKYKTYTGCYIGAYTYCWNTTVNNGLEFEASNNILHSNLQIGNFNSIANNLRLYFGTNHNIKTISTGAVPLFLKANNKKISGYKSAYNQKSSIIVQNDVWIGENVTIVPNVIVRNGAVIARNSHVVSDVPPYAIVGGNPARVIGFRYTEELIEKLQMIQWWYWESNKILEYAEYFTEDVEGFCSRFYEEALQRYNAYPQNRSQEDIWFAFVDYYEEYSSFAHILEEFLDTFYKENKKLILFIRDDCPVDEIDNLLFYNLQSIVKEITVAPDILCSVEIIRGDISKAKTCFLNCSHYIMTRTYGTVYFTCLADQLGIEILSGTDSHIQFKKQHNMIKVGS